MASRRNSTRKTLHKRDSYIAIEHPRHKTITKRDSLSYLTGVEHRSSSSSGNFTRTTSQQSDRLLKTKSFVVDYHHPSIFNTRFSSLVNLNNLDDSIESSQNTICSGVEECHRTHTHNQPYLKQEAM